jgi:hypothetical protein
VGVWEHIKVWVVFLLCFIFSLFGVLISFWVFGSTITGINRWVTSIVISVAMLGLTYAAKYANSDARTKFTPLDLTQYLVQGFLWPSTWPALADLLGIQNISPPEN